MAAYTDPFFDDVNYKGAFDEYSSDNLDALWVRGWTHLWERAMTPYICADYNYDDVVNLIDILSLLHRLEIQGRSYASAVTCGRR